MALMRSRPGIATDPMAPLFLFGSTALLGAVLSWPLLLWLALGGVAGYSLSGSV